MDQEIKDMVLGSVRRGTLVWIVPSDDVLPGHLTRFQPSGRTSTSIFAGTLQRVVTENPYSVPIEALQTGDFIMGMDGEAYMLRRLVRSAYRGVMTGILLPESVERIWLTGDQRLLGRTLPRGHLIRPNQSKGIEPSKMIPPLQATALATQHLWSKLQSTPFGEKFRLHQSVGNDLVDLDSPFHQLVILIDPKRKLTHDEMRSTIQRDARLRLLGLDVLHFSAEKVERELTVVLRAIQHQMKIRREVFGESRWVQAGSFLPGDWLTFGKGGKSIEIKSCEHMFSEEEVFSLELEGAYSFLTLSATLLAIT
jgi:very-short-patch-repair endonuclease